MFCPDCKAEYVPGVYLCPDCRVPLEPELPPEPEPSYVEHVTVLSTGNPVVLAMAKSVLESAGIGCYVKGEVLQDLFRIGTAEVQVAREEEERAKELLRRHHFGPEDSG
ncbi:MAG TPA: DUF2007 domain-containing protein [Candidatus Deferrimicrobiaceae bacterium]